MDAHNSDLTATRVLTYIDSHFDEPITPRTVAEAIHYSLGHLTHVTRKTLGRSVGELILQRRIDAARTMLEETPEPVAWIAAAVGFTDLAYFSRRFSQQMGASPSQWRKLHRAKVPSKRVCHACGQPLPLVAPAQYGPAEISEAAS
jgi:AraC-like DNA-binding protein